MVKKKHLSVLHVSYDDVDATVCGKKIRKPMLFTAQVPLFYNVAYSQTPSRAAYIAVKVCKKCMAELGP